MPKARRKPKPVNLHARRAKALAGRNEVTLNEKIPGSYSGTSYAPSRHLHALVLQGLSSEEAILCRAACDGILRVRRDPKVFAKHPSNDYATETDVAHLLAAAGHALRAARIEARLKAPDRDYHPDKAVCRLAAALAVAAARRTFKIKPVPPKPLD